jgi:hypothetical protein
MALDMEDGDMTTAIITIMTSARETMIKSRT